MVRAQILSRVIALLLAVSLVQDPGLCIESARAHNGAPLKHSQTIPFAEQAIGARLTSPFFGWMDRSPVTERTIQWLIGGLGVAMLLYPVVNGALHPPVPAPALAFIISNDLPTPSGDIAPKLPAAMPPRGSYAWAEGLSNNFTMDFIRQFEVPIRNLALDPAAPAPLREKARNIVKEMAEDLQNRQEAAAYFEGPVVNSEMEKRVLARFLEPIWSEEAEAAAYRALAAALNANNVDLQKSILSISLDILPSIRKNESAGVLAIQIFVLATRDEILRTYFIDMLKVRGVQAADPRMVGCWFVTMDQISQRLEKLSPISAPVEFWKLVQRYHFFAEGLSMYSPADLAIWKHGRPAGTARHAVYRTAAFFLAALLANGFYYGRKFLRGLRNRIGKGPSMQALVFLTSNTGWGYFLGAILLSYLAAGLLAWWVQRKAASAGRRGVDAKTVRKSMASVNGAYHDAIRRYRAAGFPFPSPDWNSTIIPDQVRQVGFLPSFARGLIHTQIVNVSPRALKAIPVGMEKYYSADLTDRLGSPLPSDFESARPVPAIEIAFWGYLEMAWRLLTTGTPNAAPPVRDMAYFSFEAAYKVLEKVEHIRELSVPMSRALLEWVNVYNEHGSSGLLGLLELPRGPRLSAWVKGLGFPLRRAAKPGSSGRSAVEIKNAASFSENEIDELTSHIVGLVIGQADWSHVPSERTDVLSNRLTQVLREVISYAVKKSGSTPNHRIIVAWEIDGNGYAVSVIEEALDRPSPIDRRPSQMPQLEDWQRAPFAVTATALMQVGNRVAPGAQEGERIGNSIKLVGNFSGDASESPPRASSTGRLATASPKAARSRRIWWNPWQLIGDMRSSSRWLAQSV